MNGRIILAGATAFLVLLAGGPISAAPFTVDPGAANAGTVRAPKYCKLEVGTTANGFAVSTMVESGTTACRTVGTRKNIYKCTDGKWVGTGQPC